ncbi:MAG: InlB B-repeat-containing protein, partial [Roseburia sp.]|nr:InlB B-repeat-containing protein [Roseburia sp.]
PVVTDPDTGIGVKVNTFSNGLFDKFSTAAKVKEIDATDEIYADAQAALSPVSNKFAAYDISVTKDGNLTPPKYSVEIIAPVPENFYPDKISVYFFDGENLRQLKHSLTKDGKISFETKNTGVFVISELPCAINFDGNGAEYSEKQYVYCGETVQTPANPERRGYSFSGWSLGGSAYDFSKPVEKDLTISAVWTANSYTVSYRIDGETVETQEVVFGKNVELYDYTKTGYTVGWYDGEAQVISGAWDIAYDVTLTAKETPNQYTATLVNDVSICCDAVSKGDETVAATYDSNLSKINIPRLTGYLFEGYYTSLNGKGEKYISSDGSGAKIWQLTQDTTLYANWTLDEKYSGYTYISTYSDLKNMSANGKYLLINDINMNGNSWTPIRNFNGVLDGGCHSVYNFRITSGAAEDELVLNFGLFGSLSGLVENLQVGKAGTTSSIVHDEDYKRYNAGMIAGYCTGRIHNCRVINCSINLRTFAQDQSYKNQEFWINAGGACGNLYAGTVEKCQIEGTSVSTNVEVRYSVISGTSRAAGAVGFLNSANLLDCIVKSCNIYAVATSHNGALGNWSGKPHARAGCLVGTMVKWESQNAVISRCVEASNSISANKNAGSYTDNVNNNTGTSYAGAIIGETGDTTPSDLIGVNSGLQCSGTDSNYPNFTKITQDSYSILIQTSSAFDNGRWTSDNGKISIKFYPS